MIPKDIRERFKLKENSRLFFEVRGESIIMTPSKEGEKFVEDFCSVVQKKLDKKINLKELYYTQIEGRSTS